MLCIGVSRTLAMVYENSWVLNDKNEFSSISLPVNITPYSMYLIAKTDVKEKYLMAEKIYNLLLQENVNVLFDDRDYISIGAKLKDSKITGVPYTCVLGKTLDSDYITIENNKDGKKTDVDLKDFVKYMKEFEIARKEGITIEEVIQNNLLTDDNKLIKTR